MNESKEIQKLLTHSKKQVLKVSLITVTYNSAATLQHTIASVRDQDYPEIEYIVVDGGSHDGTLEIIQSFPEVVSQWISEPDNGLYDALNKGIKMATGDIVGMIHSDDFYHRKDAISSVVAAFKNNDVQAVFADIRFVKPNNLEKTVRYYSSASFNINSFKHGIMPAHPTFFTYTSNYEQYGFYKSNYRIAADFELMARFLYKHQLSYKYLHMDMLKMRLGGVSTNSLKSTWIINQEDLRACKENDIHTNYLMLYSRYFKKIWEYVFTKN